MKSIALRFAICLLLVLPAPASVAYRHLASSASENARASVKSVNTVARRARRGIRLRLFFVNPKHPSWELDCGGGEFVNRTIPATRRLADAALRLLFAGPNAEEKAKGMLSLAPLGDYYLGVSIKRGVAIVNFRTGAEEHLEGTACEQQQVGAPIDKTLRQFRQIKSVRFAINGKILEEGDA